MDAKAILPKFYHAYDTAKYNGLGWYLGTILTLWTKWRFFSVRYRQIYKTALLWIRFTDSSPYSSTTRVRWTWRRSWGGWITQTARTDILGFTTEMPATILLSHSMANPGVQKMPSIFSAAIRDTRHSIEKCDSFQVLSVVLPMRVVLGWRGCCSICRMIQTC
jgi:hypothetical protein